MATKQLNKLIKPSRRYYLHSKVRKLGYKVNTSSREIEIPSNIEAIDSKYLDQLLEIGYNLQYTIV